jgi:cyanophycinase
MSIHLVGGGRRPEHAERVYAPFVSEVAAHATSAGREAAEVAVLVVFAPDDESAGRDGFGYFAALLEALGPVRCRPLLLAEGAQLTADQLGGIDGLLVAGGLTPAYHHALVPVAAGVATLVRTGLPYLGFSAGAAVAARRAIIGGWRIGELAVCAADNAEDLDQLTVVDGLGLTELAVDVHAAQWGNLSRLVMAVDSGAVDHGVAIDEDTVLVAGERGVTVRGAGQAWWATTGTAGVTVKVIRDAGVGGATPGR